MVGQRQRLSKFTMLASIHWVTKPATQEIRVLDKFNQPGYDKIPLDYSDSDQLTAVHQRTFAWRPARQINWDLYSSSQSKLNLSFKK